MSTSLPLLLLLSLLSLSPPSHSLTPSSSPCTAPDHSSTLQVFHVSSPCSPFKPPPAQQQPTSWQDSILQIQSQDQDRLQYLSSLAAIGRKSVVPIASGRQIVQSATYVVRAKIGTPAQTFLMAVDTSNDAAWVPCSGSCLWFCWEVVCCLCLELIVWSWMVPNPTCTATACSFNLTYGGSTVAADLSQDTITLATDAVPGYTFGCIQKATGNSVPPQGLLGLGRGPLSLLSQTQSLYQSTFSYCLPSFKSANFSGSLRLGPKGQPIRIKYTQLLRNPRRSSLYYVNMIGVRVGRKIVDIPPSTVFSRLVQPVYTAVRDEFRRRVTPKNLPVSSLGGFDTCYNVAIVPPTITLMFTGMNVTLPADNFLIHSTAGSTTCLAMAASPSDGVNSVLNVIANMQQQNHRILFDVPNSRLGVSRETCT
ncbi:hypothetical protein RHMOL_Rhmol07G0080400 [Rhododendron molle]|uniref:Uncharacterized protein n=1 Tax=Rhododendron molle TaxID=49168 RepID=A0ACC0MZQ8_RHOML|nr:hypothetical protein RHMOL_Rhmol07G0080400 [Rhododendron molle]